MALSIEFTGRNRSDRYLEAFLAYERRCKNRDKAVYGQIASSVDRFPSNTIKLLDIGVGSGSSACITQYFSSHDVHITAIDNNPSFFSFAKKTFIANGISNLSLITMNMLDLEKSAHLQGFFDLVLAGNVLYRHVRNSKLIHALLSCCKPKGYLAIVHSPSVTPWTMVLSQFGNWDSQQYGANILLDTLRSMHISCEVSTVHYTIDVKDILDSNRLTEEQVDFLLWIIPKSMSLTTTRARKLIKVLRESCDPHNSIVDKRKIIIIQR